MDAVISKDRAALLRHIGGTNPEARFHSKQTMDVRKHVKNLSVRYLSTIMPTKHTLHNFIVLPLFQEGQDIPIDNDGRTAIVLAHVPSLEQMIKSWYERMANEQQEKEKRMQRKAEKREASHEGSTRSFLTKHGKRKRRCPQSKGVECSKNDSQNEVWKNTNKSQPSVDNDMANQATTSSSNTRSGERKEPSSEFDCESSSTYGVPTVGAAEECEHVEWDNSPPVLYAMNSLPYDSERVLDPEINKEEFAESCGEDWTCPTHPFSVHQEPVNDDNSNTVTASSQLYSDPPENSSVEREPYVNEMFNSSLSDFDPEDILQMERQIASIQAAKKEQVVENRIEVNDDYLLESQLAAFYLQKELNGEEMESMDVSEPVLQVEPSFVKKKVIEPVKEPTTTRPTDPPPSSSKAKKKQSASGRIKQKLLQRIAEGRDINVDATNAAASEDDYRNTFCYQCRIDFTSCKGLYLHNVKIHSEGEVKCDVCLKPLKNRITLMKHKKLHLGAEDMKCMCTECGRPFKDKRALTAHITYSKHMTGVPQFKT